MRVKVSNSKNGSQSFSIIKDVTINNKRTTKIVELLGNKEYIESNNPGMSALEWAKARALTLTNEEKNNGEIILESFNSSQQLPFDSSFKYNIGYLFLESIYHSLKLDTFCKKTAKNYKFEFDLDNILSNMCFSRILNPSSKKSDFKNKHSFIDRKKHLPKLEHFYRSLEIISANSDKIEEHIYNTSLDVIDRNTDVLFYDCTNFFFEIDDAHDLLQYGKSKENRPNPIIQMGLFMDGSGLPLAFSLFSGNSNEQSSLKPLETRIIKDFNLSQFIVCTDAGLSSHANRIFNNTHNRKFITTQSIKKLKKHLKEFALDPSEWYFFKEGQIHKTNIDNIELENNHNIYYKERWINENGLEQKLFISFSPKHKLYQQHIRNQQIQRALSKIEKPSNLNKKNPNDCARFIKTLPITKDGELATTSTYTIDYDKISEEERYDGFYGVCTNLECDAQEIMKINRQRWEIEETFRIMKSEFKARPVYLRKEDRIKAHFTICFISLLIFRILEKKLDEKYSYKEIIDKLKEMEVVRHNEGMGYKPIYTRNQLTDDLHKIFDFRTDTQIISNAQMKKILKKVKTLK